MGARNGIYGIQLHKTKSLNQSQKIRPFGGATGLFCQRVPVQKQLARRFVVKLLNHQWSTPLQRVAKCDLWSQGNDLIALNRRIGHLGSNDIGGFAPDFQPTGIHCRQLARQPLQ